MSTKYAADSQGKKAFLIVFLRRSMNCAQKREKDISINRMPRAHLSQYISDIGLI